MADAITFPTTQRAYTLRLRSAPVPEELLLQELKSRIQNALAANRPEPDEDQLRKEFQREEEQRVRAALWSTHEAINRGAKVFGDWLLTLRGGLDQALVQAEVIEGSGDKKKSRQPNDEERRNRRILLALSWLSVEDDQGAPTDLRVATGADADSVRKEKVLVAFRDILAKRSISDVGDWVEACSESLCAHIRKDAVWVNRSARFDQVTSDWNKDNARKDAYAVLSHVLSPEFLTIPARKKPKKDTDDAERDDEEERRSAIKASSKGAGNRTRHAFSHLLGEGKPFGNPKRKLLLRDNWHAYLKSKLDETGIPVVPVRRKGKTNKESGPAHTELQREMFSKAASRVAQIVTKQRQQEADRLARKEADADLRKMEGDQSFNAALNALRSYCDEYRLTSGATGEFLIRPRQVTGWDRVIRRWSTITEADPDRAREARVEAVKEVQEMDEDKKFGDANLFFRLAEDRFTPTWRHDGGADPAILECFVKGTKARGDSERLKVAAFRHPDPYLNPIFCQFGVSRPTIRFRRLKAFTDDPAGNDPRALGLLLWHPASNSAKLTLLHGVSQRLDREIGSASDQVQQNTEVLCAVSRRGRLGAAAGGLPNASSPARVAGVFDVKRIARRATDEEEDADSAENEAGKLKEPQWNGTLSADRRELQVIGRLIEKGHILKANRRRQQLRWTLTVSMEMEGRGPWFRYIASATDQTPFFRTMRKDKPKDKNDPTKGLAERKGDKRIEAEGWPWQEFNKPLKDNRDGTALVEDTQAARGDKACLLLSRLPGLRMLSVDLGHRFAASCAVWEALDAKSFDIRKIVEAAKGRGERIEGSPDSAYVHVIRKKKKEKRGRSKEIEESIIYRRIGDYILPDGSAHPAPWARLDRQFFIKLQGEQRSARAALANETAMVTELAKAFGLLRENMDAGRSRSVDELMRRTVRIATLSLKRHGRQAKIAYAFMPNCPGIPGMGGKLKTITREDEEHICFLTDALMDWHALAVDTDWDGSAARKLWKEHINSLPGGFDIARPAPLDPNAERLTRQEQRKADEELRERLKPIARFLAKADPNATNSIHEAWAKLWGTDDGIERTNDDFEHTLICNGSGKVIDSRTSPKQGKDSPGGWHQHLRTITDWIMGWHLPGVQSEDWKRNVGGLSLTRIATMKSLYQLQKAFAMRSRPHELRGAPEKGESNAGVAQSILDAMEGMREQRVKQIASRIVEAALGVGIEQERVWDDVKRKWDSPKRPRQLLYYVDEQGAEHGNPRFKPCHAIVIENLRNYRPDELQTRRENRALMSWSAGKVRKYLEEACQLHGLHLREVTPNYTSRQDSRTGAPGIRCQDFPVIDLIAHGGFLWRHVKRALKKIDDGSADQHSLYIRALLRNWNAAERTWTDGNSQGWVLGLDGRWLGHDSQPQDKDKYKSPPPVRLPWKGGEIFVSAGPGHSGATAIQADLNAAANIGLRALLDPDWPGRWWYVPAILAEDGYRIPNPDKCSGAACLEGWRLAQDTHGYTVHGTPIELADDHDVKQAQTRFDEAESEVKAARNDLKNSKKGKTGLSVEQATQRAEVADAARRAAKSRLNEVKRAAKAKFYINLWRDPSTAPLSTGSWIEYGEYENRARYRVIQMMRRSARLPPEETCNAPALA